MKYYCKYSLEDSLWGVGLQFLEFDCATGVLLRQVNDFGNILFYWWPDSAMPKEQGTCHPAEVTLGIHTQYEEDVVLPSVFESKWAQATSFYDIRLDSKKLYTLQPGEVRELITAFNQRRSA